MIKKKSNNFFLILSICFIVFGSCKTKRLIDKDITTINLDKEIHQIVNNVNVNNISPESISLRGKAVFEEGEKKITFNIHIAVRKDSLIWASLRSSVLGIEALRVKITPDSIYYLDRIQKMYFKKSFSYLEEFSRTELTFFNLQDILFASPRILEKDYSSSLTDQNKFYLTSQEGNHYLINNETYRIEKMILTDPRKNTLNIIFNRWDNVEGGSSKNYLFPSSLFIELETERKFVFEIDYKKIEIDKNINISFKIPKSYVEI